MNEKKKSLDDYFYDWQLYVFQFSDGTGEKYILSALKKFMSLVKEDQTYDYKDIEKILGKTVTWLLINILCHDSVIEFNTTPRYGWLSERGVLLKNYLKDKNFDNYPDISDEYCPCTIESCYCGNRYEEGRKCNNPFFIHFEPP